MTFYKRSMTTKSVLLFGVLGIFLHLHAQAAEIIKIGGSGTGLGTLTLLGETFEKNHPGIKIQVFPSLGSTGGIEALSKGGLDIATSARPLKPEERTVGMVAIEYVKTPFVFVAHKDVRKDGLTTQELEDIFQGKTMNWPDGSRVRLVLRPETDTATKIVKSISPAMEKAMAVARSNKSKILAVTDQDCTKYVANARGTLGTSTLTQIITEKSPLKSLDFNGVRPSIKSLSDGTYRLSTTLHLITNSQPRPAVRQFLDFVFSNEGLKIMTKSGNLVSYSQKGILR